MKTKTNKNIHKIRRNNILTINIIIVIFFMIVLPFNAISNQQTIDNYNNIKNSGGWELQNSGTTVDLSGISFVDENFGTVVGESGTIIHSDDGGVNWIPQTSGVYGGLLDVSFYDENKGVTVGHSGAIVYTDNGGDNWIVAQDGWMISYYAVQMITSSLGYAVGVNSIFQPFVSWTNNGWQSWSSTNFYLNNGGVLNEGHLTDVYLLDDTNGFATASVWNGDGVIVKKDSGQSWSTNYWNYDNRLFAIDFPSADVGYAVGTGGVILKTSDGGDNWMNLDSGVGITLNDVSFITEDTGIVIGEYGHILRTDDGGVTWNIQDSGTTVTLNAIELIDTNIGFVVGNSGTILYTETGGYEDDITPPETICILDGEMEGDIYISDVTVTLEATDDISGVNYTMVKTDNGEYEIYEDPFVVSENGDHIIYYYSVDNSGNIEDEKTCEFTIQHPCNINISLTGGFGLTTTIKNTGEQDLANITMNIVLDGGIIIIGKNTSVTFDIASGEEISLRTIIIGFGKTDIAVQIDCAEISTSATVFLCFVLGI